MLYAVAAEPHLRALVGEVSSHSEVAAVREPRKGAARRTLAGEVLPRNEEEVCAETCETLGCSCLTHALLL